MFFYLSYLHKFLPHSEFAKIFNVFQYISLRAMGAGLTSFLISLCCGKEVIRHLLSLKMGQPVRTAEEVRELFSLHGKKAGTPTMGGILLIGSVIIATLLWARPTNSLVWVALLTAFFLSGVGFFDDYLKVVKKNATGIKSRDKFLLQALLAIIVSYLLLHAPSFRQEAQKLYLPLFKEAWITHMGAGVILLYFLMIVGSSNAVNLTDGLDGLAAGCSAMAATTYAVFTYLSGNLRAATYLHIPHNPYAGELSIVAIALAGASLGFLWWNCYPAQIFMGDTGSLAIGGLLAILAISAKQELLLILVGGVFVAEALSVILQVGSFKLRGKRIFKMAPLHHHFELSGWSESKVTVRFWIAAIIFGIVGLITLKLR